MTATKRKDYAAGTKTTIEASEQQIKTMLKKAGALAVAIMEEPGRAIVAFHLNDRAIQFRLPLPRRNEERFVFRKANQFGGVVRNSESTIDNLWMQGSRERWRQLHLCIKAKLEAVAQEIETFDEAFLPHIQMPDGRTVGDAVIPEMGAQLAGKPMQPLLPPPRP